MKTWKHYLIVYHMKYGLKTIKESIYINKLGAEKVGLSKDDIIGKTDYDIRPSYIADKCIETDMNIINGNVDVVSKNEKSKDINDVSYDVHKFIINRDQDSILGGIAKEVTLDNSIQMVTEYIMSNNLNECRKNNYYDFLKNKLKSLSVLLNSMNIDIFLYDKKDNEFTFYISSNDDVCIFNKESKFVVNEELEKEILSENNYFSVEKYKQFTELNNNYKKDLVSKLYNITIADNLFSLVNIQYEKNDSIIYKDEISINEILKKISILIYQVENKNDFFKYDEKNSEIEDSINFEHIKSDFLANISHEFKTPINIILSTSQLLISNVESKFNNITEDKYIEYLKMLKQNSYRLLRLVNNIIDTAKIDNNFYELNLGNYNIIKIIEDITLSTVPYVEEKNRNIIFDTDEEEVILSCDPDKIERVILNLISNAIKHSEVGSDIKVSIDTNFSKNMIYVSVENKGEPINEKYVNQIFGQFRQGEELFRRRTEGSGIGLYLSKYFIEMHKGNIWLNLENRENTEFIFSIPIVLNEKNYNDMYDIDNSKIIERCNIEFSDIYQ